MSSRFVTGGSAVLVSWRQGKCIWGEWNSPPSNKRRGKKHIWSSQGAQGNLQLLLSCSVVTPEDCLFRAAPSVTVQRCVKVKQGQGWQRFYTSSVFIYNDGREREWWEKVKIPITIWTHCLLISSPLMRRFYLSKPEWCMMGPGGRRPDRYQYAYPHFYTPHTQIQSLFLFVLHPGSLLDFLFSLFVSESEETSLSVSAFSLLCACTQTHTQIQYVHRHTNTCTHRDRHAHTHRGSLPSAAVMAPSCQNIPAFSPSLSPKQPDWACLCRFTETAVYPPSLYRPPFSLSPPDLCILASWFCFL